MTKPNKLNVLFLFSDMESNFLVRSQLSPMLRWTRKQYHKHERWWMMMNGDRNGWIYSGRLHYRLPNAIDSVALNSTGKLLVCIFTEALPFLSSIIVSHADELFISRPCLVAKKFPTVSVTSNLRTHV